MTAAESPPNNALSRGFSLLEIVIAIAVLAILTAAAMPSMVELGRRMTISGHTNDLVGALTAAKSEAAKRGTVAGVGLVGGSSDWSTGWQVYADSNSDGQLTGTDTVLGSYAALADNYSVKTKVTNGASDALVMFSAQGSLATPATQVDINVCRPDGEAAQSVWIHVGASGEITSQRNTSSSNDLAPGC
jgi:prepilin-type N-terminal cleavage/methylation domain-containing protein